MSVRPYENLCSRIYEVASIRGATRAGLMAVMTDRETPARIIRTLEHLTSLGVLIADGEYLSAALPVPADIMEPDAIEPDKEIRFMVPARIWKRYRAAAAEAGYPLTTWARLTLDGILPSKPAEAPVRPSFDKLRERIMAFIGTEGGISKRIVPQVAAHFGVSPAAIHSSLGSMVASKRLVREGDTYRRADK